MKRLAVRDGRGSGVGKETAGEEKDGCTGQVAGGGGALKSKGSGKDVEALGRQRRCRTGDVSFVLRPHSVQEGFGKSVTD